MAKDVNYKIFTFSTRRDNVPIASGEYGVPLELRTKMRKIALVLVAALFVLSTGIGIWDCWSNTNGDGWNPSTPVISFVLGYSRVEPCTYLGQEDGWDCTTFDGAINPLPWAWVDEPKKDDILHTIIVMTPKWLEWLGLLFATIALAAPPPRTTTLNRGNI